MSRPDEAMVRRHSPVTIATHATIGLLAMAVAVTGLTLLGVAPAGLSHLLGGHDAVVTWHRRLGLALTALFLAIPLVAPRATWRFLRDVTRYRRGDRAWPLAFIRYARHPDRLCPPRHGGRFDPVQRVVFALMTLALAVLVITGVALLTLPASAADALALCVRVHETTGWLFVGLVGAHVLAGSGALPTHRRVGRAMVTGQVPVRLAQRLWPTWTTSTGSLGRSSCRSGRGSERRRPRNEINTKSIRYNYRGTM